MPSRHRLEPPHPGRTRYLVALTLWCALGFGGRIHAAAIPSATPPLSFAGRWLVDADGRVVTLHGFNRVAKSAPFHPAAFGFGEDDVTFLAREGFSTIRLGVDFRGLMPTPGIVDEGYLDHLADTVTLLAAHRQFVLIDFHQDGFSPMFNGNGLPDWMAISDGLPNPPDAVFPLYYIQNPAMQRAFEHFWDDTPGPGGIGIQTYYLQGVTRVVERFRNEPWVIGYEPMNEPWPGATWAPCIQPAGCTALEQELLEPFTARVAAIVHAIAPTQSVFVEPFVLFNFGQGATSLPGPIPGVGLAFHSYAVSVAGEEAVADFAVAAAERDAKPLLATEFGATTDPVLLTRLTEQMDARLIGWMDWSYDESIIADHSRPAGHDNLRNPAAFAALARPYALAVAGTPTRMAFDATTGRFDLTYTTARAGGGQHAADTATLLSIPRQHYPNGFRIKLRGGRTGSSRCPGTVAVRARRGAQAVNVRLVPRTMPPPGGCPAA
jgi:endoglycosylceramidase